MRDDCDVLHQIRKKSLKLYKHVHNRQYLYDGNVKFKKKDSFFTWSSFYCCYAKQKF